MKINTLLTTVFISLILFSQLFSQTVPPQAINFQGVARDNQALLTNQTLEVRFTILRGGIEVYKETHSVTTDGFGLFTVRIGQGFPISGSFPGIDWGAGSHGLKVEINNGNGFVDLGTTSMVSVPYALYADKAATVDGSISDLNDVVAPAPAVGEILKWDGTMWVASPDAGGDFNAGAGISISGDTIYNIGGYGCNR